MLGMCTIAREDDVCDWCIQALLPPIDGRLFSRWEWFDYTAYAIWTLVRMNKRCRTGVTAHFPSRWQRPRFDNIQNEWDQNMIIELYKESKCTMLVERSKRTRWWGNTNDYGCTDHRAMMGKCWELVPLLLRHAPAPSSGKDVNWRVHSCEKGALALGIGGGCYLKGPQLCGGSLSIDGEGSKSG